MKVFLFSSQWPEYMIEFANALSGHCQTILMLPTNHKFSPAHEKLISRQVIYEPFEVIFYKSIRRNIRMLFHILKRIWKHKPDILHIQSNGHRLFYWVYFLKPWNTKIVNTIHDPVKHLGDELSHSIDDTRVKYWSRFFTDKFIVHGKFLQDQLSKTYHISKSRIAVIPHGHFAIYKKFQKYQVKEDPNTILFFGRIWQYKGLDILIEAANIVINKNRKLKFVIAGKGEDIRTYQQKVKFKNNIIFENRRIENEEVGLFFNRSSVVVLPYKEATQSGVIPIAYAYSKPVIVTDVGALSEVVIHKKTGLLIKPNSVESLVNGIMFLVENVEKRKEMGHNAYNYAINELSWEIVAEKVFKLYKSIL